MASLFSPVSIRETGVPNRLMVSPMCQYSCFGGDGLATDWHLVHLGSRAVGGAGVVMAEATAVEPRGRISPEDLGLWSPAHAEALAPVASFVSGQGSVPAIQLAHAGRKASKTAPHAGSDPLGPDEGGWETIAPTAEPYPYDDEPPLTRAMDGDDIREVIDAFAESARYAVGAGFEIVEVHAAHGYLLHEFLSPVTNRRDDDYGGGFENRTRLVREVVRAVRDVVGDRPVFVRVSGTDWLPDRESWTVEDSIRLSDALFDDGADLIDVSSGGIVPEGSAPHRGANYQVSLAERIREGVESGVLVGTVGGIVTPQQADAVIRNGRADLAIVGREFLRDPYFGLRAAHELDADGTEPPVQYRRAF